jgi:hypothetical protein
VSGISLRSTATTQGLLQEILAADLAVVAQSVEIGDVNSDLYLLFAAAYLSLLSDSPIDPDKPKRVRRAFVKALLSDPLKLIKTYASLADAILRSMDSSSDLTVTGEFLPEMKHTPIFREYLHFFRTGDSSTLRFLLSFLYFGKKLEIQRTDLESEAFRSWLEIEVELDRLVIPGDIRTLLKRIVHLLGMNLDDSILLPKHGPGSTAEGFTDPNDKLDNLSFDPKSRYVFRPNSFGRVDVERSSLDGFPSTESEQTARLKFVPKNIRTMRSICMEPVSRMFLQQEVMRWLTNSMASSVLGLMVTLQDQTRSQLYALAGSECNLVDTIDLSAASDRLHVDIVKGVMPRSWLFYLLGTRTSTVDTGDGLVELKKFAPMGSALCFPVQCIVYSAICILGYLITEQNIDAHGDLSQVRVPRDMKRYVSSMERDPYVYRIPHSYNGEHSFLIAPCVYGDDIACDSRTTGNIMTLLGRLGFLVNEDKSFVAGQSARESCGVYAFLGADVTPFLFRVKHFKDVLTPSAYASLIACVNNAGDFHFRHLHSFLIQYLFTFQVECKQSVPLREVLPFTDDPLAFGIWHKDPRHPRTRENLLLQREERKSLLVTAVPEREELSPHMDDYAYNQWMRARIRGGSNENNFSSPRKYAGRQKFKWGWTPT